jgi:pterin-4a-carbinolamine dehydratase
VDTRENGPIGLTTTPADPHEQAQEADVLGTGRVTRALAEEHGWRLREGALVRELVMRDFEEAMRLLERVAAGAVDYRRRPDMCISEFNHVRLQISNPHHAGLTAAELRLAAKVSVVLEDFGVEDATHRG